MRKVVGCSKQQGEMIALFLLLTTKAQKRHKETPMKSIRVLCAFMVKNYPIILSKHLPQAEFAFEDFAFHFFGFGRQ